MKPTTPIFRFPSPCGEDGQWPVWAFKHGPMPVGMQVPSYVRLAVFLSFYLEL
jgi:hypothetical protein